CIQRHGRGIEQGVLLDVDGGTTARGVSTHLVAAQRCQAAAQRDGGSASRRIQRDGPGIAARRHTGCAVAACRCDRAHRHIAACGADTHRSTVAARLVGTRAGAAYGADRPTAGDGTGRTDRDGTAVAACAQCAGNRAVGGDRAGAQRQGCAADVDAAGVAPAGGAACCAAAACNVSSHHRAAGRR
ncbi:MAG: hypothetical protein Q7U12_17025, partial [Undibacterium sp.]|nr:hypothetical protein [Undibacterium sp.]